MPELTESQKDDRIAELEAALTLVGKWLAPVTVVARVGEFRDVYFAVDALGFIPKVTA